MHPGIFAAADPGRPAIIMGGSGAVTTYAELEARSNQFAHLARDHGLRPGDGVAIMCENRPELLIAAWGAQRSGLRLTAVNWHLTPAEAAYIIADCGARILIRGPEQAALAGQVPARRLTLGAPEPGWESFGAAIGGYPATPISDECEGEVMLYSSGTTGRPKGISRPVTGVPFGQYPDIPGRWLRDLLGMEERDVYLSPAPLYHAAPLNWTMACHRTGATTVIMERFDPGQALGLIGRHAVTHSQWVPTMFSRMLKLPEPIRAVADLSSLRWAVHAAAPCPVPVKRAMIEWWGPILFEYYSMTEGFGAAAISSQDWLRKPGSVGKPLLGSPHIAGPDGAELPPGETGTIWFEGGSPAQYHGDPAKMAAATDDRGWRTVGDIGYLDSDGYLFLTDRASNLIISGGVNIYPQEIENVLTLHAEVLDAAVLGVPDPDMGEQVKAVILAADPAGAGPELAARLAGYCRQHLAGFKCPRSYEFTTDELRSPVGKVRQGPLRERYGTGPGIYPENGAPRHIVEGT